MSRRSGWEPTTEAEVALYDALLAGDQERYFRVLGRVELLLPVSADAAAGRSPMGWATWTSNDHTHLLAFTSLQSMRTCLAEHAGAARRMAVADLSDVWPNQDWWLAVNPGLPIEGYLPPWFVAQLGRGDARLPQQVTSGPRDRLERVQALERAKAARAAGAQSHQRDPVRVHATVSQRALPSSTQSASTHVESASPWLEAEVTSSRTIDAPDPNRLPRREPARSEAAKRHSPEPASWQAERERALDELAAAWPSRAGARSADESRTRYAPNQAADANGSGSPLPRREPEATMRSAPSRTRADEEPAWATQSRGRANDDGDAWDTPPASGRERRGEGAWPRRGTDARSATSTRAGEESSAWLTPPRDRAGEEHEETWGSPSGDGKWAEPESPATAPQDDERKNGNAPDQPKHAEPEPAFVPANQVEADLFEAAEAGNTDTFLSTLLLATVYIPKGTGTENGKWRPQPIDGEPHLICYTSSQHLPDGLELVSIKFIKLIQEWPDPGWSFAVNPGTPVGATLPGGQLLALANWAKEVGLIRDEDGEGAPTTEEHAGPVAGRANPELTVLQKAVAPSQIDYYLERGYDRVSGFVHRAHEVGHLRDAQQMRRALGLDYEGSPFKPTDTEIYLLRWSAYRPSLYRIPYGGQTEAAMKAMEGWVIERAPFRGNGFAPGESKEIIAEFKVDSARLPHGTRLIRVRDDGQEIITAVLDADNQRWLRTDGGSLA